MAEITMVGDHAAGRLRRVLGVGFGLAVIIGSTLGIGILRTPGIVAGQLRIPGAIIAIWILGGLYTLLGSICLTELGTMVPQAGGFYVYARRAFGDWVGFAVGWTDWIAYGSVLGYISIGMSEFLGGLVPSLAGAVRPVAIALLVGFVGLQWAGVRVGSWVQSWTTAMKCLAFLALVVAGLAMSSTASASAPRAAAPLAPLTLAGLVAALQAVVITFGGWQSALYFTEEDRDPVKNLPRVMIGGVLVVIVIYVLVNLALLAILPVPSLAASTLPAADAAQLVVGARGRQIITILSIVSLVPLLNAIMMIGTRILFGLGRDRLFWSRTAEVNAGGTPGVATLITTAVAIVLIATGTFQRLIAMTSFFLAVNYAICCLALVALRRREPATARPFRAWGYPWSAAIVVAGALALLVGALIGDTISALEATGLLAVGLFGHAVHRRVR
ncbi:MAG TPA: APC family permease [Kofleriaceae bacterium]|nr:APC family permease [Kofleriaceae bacterium]